MNLNYIQLYAILIGPDNNVRPRDGFFHPHPLPLLPEGEGGNNYLKPLAMRERGWGEGFQTPQRLVTFGSPTSRLDGGEDFIEALPPGPGRCVVVLGGRPVGPVGGVERNELPGLGDRDGGQFTVVDVHRLD